jgi:hypothetical protein
VSKKESPASVPGFLSYCTVPPKSSSREISVAMEMVKRGKTGTKKWQ